MAMPELLPTDLGDLEPAGLEHGLSVIIEGNCGKASRQQYLPRAMPQLGQEVMEAEQYRVQSAFLHQTWAPGRGIIKCGCRIPEAPGHVAVHHPNGLHE